MTAESEDVEPDVVTVNEAARLLRVLPMTIYRLIYRNELTPVYHVGRAIRIPIWAINDYLNRSKGK